MKIQFEAGTGKHFDGLVNILRSVGTESILYAECPVPDGASDDYGYYTLEAALVREFVKAGGNSDCMEFWYNRNRDHLEEDADADCEVYTEIEISERDLKDPAMLTEDYIVTHTPRQIAEEFTLDEINHFARTVASEFSGGDIFGSMSPEDIADEITSVSDCASLIREWYEDTDEADRPAAEDLRFAFQILSAKYVKESEE